MKLIKRLICLILAMLVCLSLGACSVKKAEEADATAAATSGATAKAEPASEVQEVSSETTSE